MQELNMRFPTTCTNRKFYSYMIHAGRVGREQLRRYP